MKRLFNFQLDDVEIGQDLITLYKGKILILQKVYLYYGPITLQYLPYGGIQSVYNHQLIINTKNGFITCDDVIYDNKQMKIKQFILENLNLVNIILPNY